MKNDQPIGKFKFFISRIIIYGHGLIWAIIIDEWLLNWEISFKICTYFTSTIIHVPRWEIVKTTSTSSLLIPHIDIVFQALNIHKDKIKNLENSN